MMNKDIKGIYIHIPFCHNICNYCDFAKGYYEEETADLYLIELEKEFLSYNIDATVIESIYIGGGSPSSLNNKQLTTLMNIINQNTYPNLIEFSIELNPSDINTKQLIILKNNNVNRISLGVQSFNNDILKDINRRHNKEDVYKSINLLKEIGFNNISIDLMYGFNNQSINDIDEAISFIKEYKISHIALYSLILEPNTIFAYQDYLKDEELDYQLESYLKHKLSLLNFENYEVSNYALNNNYSYHNLLYWTNQNYYGIGMGASGYIYNYRYYNTKSITNYLKGTYLLTKDYYHDIKELLIDDLITSFRVFNGIDLDRFNKTYNIIFEDYFSNSLSYYQDKLFIKNKKLYFNDYVKDFLNDVINTFIEDVK